MNRVETSKHGYDLCISYVNHINLFNIFNKKLKIKLKNNKRINIILKNKSQIN